MSYSVTVRTIFHRTKIDLQKWFYLINSTLDSAKVESSRKIGERLNITKDSAWRMSKKISNSILKGDKLIQTIYEQDKQ